MEKAPITIKERSNNVTAIFYGYDKNEVFRVNCHHIEVRYTLTTIYGVDRKKGHDRVLQTGNYRFIDILHSGLEAPS